MSAAVRSLAEECLKNALGGLEPTSETGWRVDEDGCAMKHVVLPVKPKEAHRIQVLHDRLYIMATQDRLGERLSAVVAIRGTINRWWRKQA